MHGQPRHTTQVCCSTLADVVIVAAKVLVRQLRHRYSIKLEVKMSSCCEAASWDASCHSRRVHRSTSSCHCPRGFFCLIRSKTSAAHVPLTPCGPHHHLGHHHHHHITYDQRCSDPPKDFVEDLQDELLLLVAADAQQVGSMSLAEQVCLQPA